MIYKTMSGITMDKSISIIKTKGISQLTFNFPNSEGVYLIVGPNGAGKTTLLVCIDRICNNLSFARGFYQPKNITGYDEYSKSEITYTVNGSSVCFKKKNSKWAATPRKNNNILLQSFGFKDSKFIRADSKRIEPSQDEVQKGSIQSADADIINTLNCIFETTKYSNLKKLKVTHGRGKSSSYFNIIKDGKSYYTEKRFSTGELAILRLIEILNNAVNDSLILLDEAEMALHPRVQVNLLKYLTDKAKQKNLTVFVSTHSPTLIRSMPASNIILLESNSYGVVNVVTPCYPARATGGIDYEEFKTFDYIFFVEDETARAILKKLINKYIILEQKHSTASTVIIPVGGFKETARMAVTTNNQLFECSSVFAVLDDDAFAEENVQPGSEFKKLLDENSIIYSLHFTPELKFIEVLSSDNTELDANFKTSMHCEIKSILNSPDYTGLHKTNPRHLAKAQFNTFISKCVASTGDKPEIVEDCLISLIANQFTDGEIKNILGPIFNRNK